MARRTDRVTIVTDGRDKGKVFIITEMSAHAAEEWALRAFLALAQAGAEIPDEVAGLGMAAIARIGIAGLQGLPWGTAKPLLDELLACVEFVPDPKKDVRLGDVINHVEEPRTLLELRARAFVLHTGFSWADVGSILASRRSASAPSTSSPAPTSPG